MKIVCQEKLLGFNLSWNEKLDLLNKLEITDLELYIDATDKLLKRLTWSNQELAKFKQLLIAKKINLSGVLFTGHESLFISRNWDMIDLLKDVWTKLVDFCIKLGIRNIKLPMYHNPTKSFSDLQTKLKDFWTNLINEANKNGIIVIFMNSDEENCSIPLNLVSFKKFLKVQYCQLNCDLNLLIQKDNDFTFEILDYFMFLQQVSITNAFDPKLEKIFSIFKNIKWNGDVFLDTLTTNTLDLFSVEKYFNHIYPIVTAVKKLTK